MTFSSQPSLLVEAPAGRHFAQFHRDPDELVESVFAFLEAGLRRDCSVLIVAGATAVDRLFARLNASKFHHKSLCVSGQLAVLDASAVLEQLETAARPQAVEFQRAVLPVLSRLQPCGRGVRVYSQLARTLWQRGNIDLAIDLEEAWNTIAGQQPLSLYCGFHMDTQSENSYTAPLEELGRTHSDILGGAEDERFGRALDRASKEIFGISLTQMAGVARQDGAGSFRAASARCCGSGGTYRCRRRSLPSARGSTSRTFTRSGYIRLYFGPLPPSRGVQRGPKTSVALQSTQFGALTRNLPSPTS